MKTVQLASLVLLMTLVGCSNAKDHGAGAGKIGSSPRTHPGDAGLDEPDPYPQHAHAGLHEHWTNFGHRDPSQSLRAQSMALNKELHLAPYGRSRSRHAMPKDCAWCAPRGSSANGLAGMGSQQGSAATQEDRQAASAAQETGWQ